MKLNKLGLKEIIKKEVEAILANEKIEESFDIDPAAFLDEMMLDEKDLSAADRRSLPDSDLRSREKVRVLKANKPGLIPFLTKVMLVQP